METLAKTPVQSISGFMAKVTTLTPSGPVPPRLSLPAKIEAKLIRPLASDWQRKWLAMEVTHPRVQHLANAAGEFCSSWINQAVSPRLLYLHGKSGTGKSHLGRKVEAYCRGSVHLALKNMPNARATMPSTGSFRWPELANEFREKNLSALPDMFAADFLFLDDVGAEDDPFKVVLDKFYQVLSRRENKFTVITSNIAAPDWASFDPRITDRLLRNSKLVDLKDVPSYAEWQRMPQK